MKKIRLFDYNNACIRPDSFVCIYTCTILNLKNVLHNEWLKLRPIHFIRINIS